MSYRIGLLDKSPLQEGESAAQAVARTVALAQQAERLGFHRFWLAEHHGARSLASSAPEILVSHILARTSQIRVGTGGVMLQHYSPFKVAETFGLLSALAPDRVDLGVGKAPGGLPHTTRALQSLHDKKTRPNFAEQLLELDTFLSRDFDDEEAPVATPRPPSPPMRFLLGASPDSSILAAELGWEFVYAAHFNGDPDNIARTFEAYARLTNRKPLLALAAFVADSDSVAERKVDGITIFKVHLPNGASVNVANLDQAAEFARQASASEFRTEQLKPGIVAGAPQSVLRRLDQLSHQFGVSEFILDIPVADAADRTRAIELLGREIGSPLALAS